MADNVTTYTTVVDVEVKGQKSVDDLNEKIGDTDEKFVSLRRQIRETTVKLQEMADQGQVGTKEFKRLSDQLDELGDQQKRVAFQSGQIEDKLAALPGPIGQIGGAFQKAKEATDTFGVGLAAATGGLTLIVGAIIAMKEALSKTSEGQQVLNRISQAFSKILAPIFAILEKVGIPLFNKFADILGWVGEKIGKFASYLGISQSKVTEVYNNIDEVSKKKAEEEKKRQEELTKKNQEELAKRKAAHEKYLKDKEEKEKEAFEKEKKDLEQQLAQMEALRRKLASKAAIIGPDGLTREERAAEEAKEAKRKEDIKKFGDAKLIEQATRMQEWAKNNQKSALQAEYEALQAQANKISKLNKFLSDEEQDNINKKLVGVKAGLQLAGGLIDKNSAAGKAVAIANTTIDTYQSAVAAYKSVVGIPVVGPFLAPVAAAAAITAGILSVKQITATQIPQVGSGGEGAASSGAGGPAPVAPSVPSFSVPQVETSGGANPSSQIAQTIGAAANKPVRAYVVSGDVTSQQALDRRTNRAATFTGG